MLYTLIAYRPNHITEHDDDIYHPGSFIHGSGSLLNFHTSTTIDTIAKIWANIKILDKYKGRNSDNADHIVTILFNGIPYSTHEFYIGEFCNNESIIVKDETDKEYTVLELYSKLESLMIAEIDRRLKERLDYAYI